MGRRAERRRWWTISPPSNGLDMSATSLMWTHRTSPVRLPASLGTTGSPAVTSGSAIDFGDCHRHDKLKPNRICGTDCRKNPADQPHAGRTHRSQRFPGGPHHMSATPSHAQPRARSHWLTASSSPATPANRRSLSRLPVRSQTGGAGLGRRRSAGHRLHRAVSAWRDTSY